MDGLLVDSEPLSREVWDRVLREHGHAMDEETLALMVGRRTSDSARIVLDRFPLPFSPEQLVAYKTQLWEEVWRAGLPVKPGVFELERKLAERGIPWAVATSSPRQYAEHILEHLGLAERCRAIAAGDEVQQGKPEPDIYLLAAQRLQVEPVHCLALEDSVPGGRAAKAAHMALIAVPDGVSTAADFPFADYVFASLSDVAREIDDVLKALAKSEGDGTSL
jgi:HAD superfamily hydrolase (TIGR01509 family)